MLTTRWNLDGTYQDEYEDQYPKEDRFIPLDEWPDYEKQDD